MTMKQLFAVHALFAVLALASQFASAANVADFIDFSLRNTGNQVILPGRL